MRIEDAKVIFFCIFAFSIIVPMPKKRILFIVNPISGNKAKQNFPDRVARCLDSADFDYEIVFTAHAGHATELAEEAVGRYDIVAAVGGDGTINEVARSLIGTETALAVIPYGSGNGLARSLHLPLRTDKAITLLQNSEIQRIDTATINGTPYISVAGIGLDAQTAYDFSRDPRRGFLPYSQYALANYLHFKEERYTLIFDGQTTLECSPLLITFANANQFGYHAIIAPQASLQDGLIDTCILNRPTLLQAPDTALKMMAGRLDHSRYFTEIKAQHTQVKRSQEGVVNIDGEPVMMPATLDIRIVPESLRILIPTLNT